MEIPKDLKNDIWDYCRANDISNIDEFTIKLIKQGFTTEKFGSTPLPTVKEKIVEKIVEVEKIIEVDKIVEVIKEVPINIVDTKLDSKMKEYIEEIESFKKLLFEATNLNSVMKQELEIEKNKNKKDMYGE